MKIGIVFPQTDFNGDFGAIRAFAQRAEALGYDYILAYDHVLGVNPDRPGGWENRPYDFTDAFYDPFVLFSYMAGATESIEFVTGILILPQRETAVVAKQAATLDVLSNGRFHLGVGVGWNDVEYTALNQSFKTRGKRVEEQVELLRQLWAEPLVTFNGRWHTIPDAGINPLPINRRIPVYFGGHADVVLRRVAKMGDGWMPTARNLEQAKAMLETLEEYLEENGRLLSDIRIDTWLRYADGTPENWQAQMEALNAFGATHLCFNTLNSNILTPEGHFEAMEKMAELL